MIIEITNNTPRAKSIRMIKRMAERELFYAELKSIQSEFETTAMTSEAFFSAVLSELALTWRIPRQLTDEPLRRRKDV